MNGFDDARRLGGLVESDLGLPKIKATKMDSMLFFSLGKIFFFRCGCFFFLIFGDFIYDTKKDVTRTIIMINTFTFTVFCETVCSKKVEFHNLVDSLLKR